MKKLWLKDILETQRCIMKIPEISQSQNIWNLIAPALTQYLAWEKWEDVSQTIQNVEQARIKAKSWKAWDAAIYDKVSWEIIGRCGIIEIDDTIPSCSIWYMLAEEYWWKWIIPECVHRIIKFAFEESEFEKIIIRCDSRNENSAKVALKCGLFFEGEFKNHIREKWSLIDMKYFWITKEQYKQSIKMAINEKGEM